jgi:hypothetical protein
VVQARLPQVVGWRAIKSESHSRNAIERGDRRGACLEGPCYDPARERVVACAGCDFAGLGYLSLKKPRMQAKPLDRGFLIFLLTIVLCVRPARTCL